LAGALLPLLGLLLAGWLTAELAGQGGKPKKEEVEEGDEPPPPPAKRKVPKREEVEESDPKPDETRPVDLAAEAKKATGDIRDFFTALAEPFDEVTTARGRVDRVEPLPRYVGPSPAFSGGLSMTRITDKGKRIALPDKVQAKQLKSVASYEEVVLREVSELLKKRDLPRLLAAEKALIHALRFHLTKRDRAADAKAWSGVEAKLRSELLKVRRAQVNTLADAEKWPDAFRLAEQLAKDNSDSAAVQLDLVRLTVRRAEQTGKLERFLAARQLLVEYEGQFPRKGDDDVRKRLIARAEKMMADALAQDDAAKKIEGLRQAARVWPELPRLQEKLRELDREHPILYVGVNHLPRYFSPATAVTDPEKQAVELLFEGLVKPSAGPAGSWTYTPTLAVTRPRVIPLGREFQLARDAFWSDGRRVSAADIRHTVGLLKQRDLPGRDSGWARLVEDPRVEGTPYQVRLTLRTGYIDLLALMAFKVLPRQPHGKLLARADDKKFGQNPVGSGPFQLQPADEGAKAVVFTANPYYQRSGRGGRPWVREIRFVVPEAPANDFSEGRIQLLLDLPTAQVAKLKAAGVKDENIRTLAPRRVYFLAVNHRKESLRNQDLRQALAHGIDRETLLKDHFRAGYQGLDRNNQLRKRAGPDTHALHPALNGPYPAGSWACSPSSRVPLNLYNPALARAKAKRARAQLKTGTIKLTLKFPNDDPRVKKACQDLCAQLNKVEGIQVTPVALTPYELRDAIDQRDYELAYWHLDYANDFYWLWPLFDPDENARNRGGSNFLQYRNDSVLVAYFRRSMDFRDFKEVKKLTHDIHARLYEVMPLIPLWQLHTHLAVHPDVKPEGVIDPLRVFSQVEEWKLEKRAP
jgi:ABC-type oligopeptide transport system substrate-binding subunit